MEYPRGGIKMGVDLIVKYKGKVIACPGRSYHYHTEGQIEKDYEKIMSQKEELIFPIKDRLISYAAYAPKNQKEVDSLTQSITEDIEYLTDELVDVGQRLLLANLLEEEDITVEEI